jgi:hypothetical protein
MTDDRTYLEDPEGAMVAIGRAYPAARTLNDGVTGHLKHIRELQVGEPWGKSEVGQRFADAYFAPGGARDVLAHGGDVPHALMTSLANAATAVARIAGTDGDNASSLATVRPDPGQDHPGK